MLNNKSKWLFFNDKDILTFKNALKYTPNIKIEKEKNLYKNKFNTDFELSFAYSNKNIFKKIKVELYKIDIYTKFSNFFNKISKFSTFRSSKSW